MRHYDFLGKTKYFIPISLFLVAVSIVVLIPQIRGLTPGIDFTGGTEFTVKFATPVETAELRDVLAGISVEGIDLSKSVIQDVAGRNTKLVTAQLESLEEEQDIYEQINETLRSSFSVEDVSWRLIGRQVSRELAAKGWQAVLLAIVVILVYISWRFRLRYAVGAVAAILHDVIIAMGVFAIFRIEVNLPTIAAFLTIVGYSLNDTIVIYDRIRENVRITRKLSFRQIINLSVNQTLARTVLTTLTSLLVVVALFLFGGEVINDFAFTLLIGFVSGIYSTVFIASPLVAVWSGYGRRR